VEPASVFSFPAGALKGRPSPSFPSPPSRKQELQQSFFPPFCANGKTFRWCFCRICLEGVCFFFFFPLDTELQGRRTPQGRSVFLTQRAFFFLPLFVQTKVWAGAVSFFFPTAQRPSFFSSFFWHRRAAGRIWDYETKRPQFTCYLPLLRLRQRRTVELSPPQLVLGRKTPPPFFFP